MTTVQFVDVDLSTILFDCNDPTGANNASWGSVATKWALGSSFNVQVPHEATRFERMVADGAFTTFSRRGLATASWRQFVSGTTEANLRLGLGRLADIVSRGGVLLIVSGTTRYLRFEPSAYPQPFAGKELELYDILQGFTVRQGLDITLACQPYFEGALVTSSATTQPNDPATGNGRLKSIVVAGDLPTPVSVKAQMDTGGTVERVLLAHTFNTAANIAALVSDTAWAQCEAANRNWNHSFNIDTAGATDSNASPGSGTSVARTTYATEAFMSQRVHHSRTTSMESLRGTWDAWYRVKASAAARHVLRLDWSPSATGETAFSNAEVVHDTTNAAAFGYVELNLGPIYIPEGTTALGGIQLRVFARRESGTGNLDWDHFWLVPRQQGAVVVPGGSSSTMLGKDLTTPSFKQTADPTWVTGAVSGNLMRLNAVNEAAGAGPNAGTIFPTGRNRAILRYTTSSGAGSTVINRAVVNVTDNTITVQQSSTKGVGTFIDALAFDAVAGKRYQARVGIVTYNGGTVDVSSITQEFLPSLASTEYLRTEPGLSRIDRLDGSGNLSGYLASEGEVSMILQPGSNLVYIRCDEITLAGYEENENKRTRTPTVTLTYNPRYAL
jgi:hypothetical protein